MAVAFKSKSEEAFALSDSITISAPSGIQDNDLLIAIIGFSDGSTVDIQSAPSGWILIEAFDTGEAQRMTSYYKTASSESGSYVWTLNSTPSGKLAGTILRFDGQIIASPISANAAPANDVLNTATPTYTPGITPDANCLLIIAVFATDSTSSGASGYAIATDNPTWTERVEITDGSTLTLAVATATRPESSATGDYSAIFTGSGTDSMANIIAIIPRVDVTVSPAVIDLTASVQAPAITGGAIVSPAVVNVTASVQAPTLTQTASKWKNNAKSDISPTIINTAKT